MSKLVVSPCSHEAAKYAVENWHYSRILPTGKIVKIGVWENDKFIGCVLFSRGASPNLGTALSLDQTQICELTRVALTKHEAPVSQILVLAIKELKESNPGLECVISFADPKEGHKGGIYQATNWIYTGQSNPVIEYFIDGRWRHTRGAYHDPRRPTAKKRQSPGKFRYLYPLNKKMKRVLAKLAKPYPNAVEGLEESRSNPVTEEQVQSLPTAREK